MVKREAARYGVTILESEVVGLVPSAALVRSAEFYLQLERFGDDQILENEASAGLERSQPPQPYALRSLRSCVFGFALRQRRRSR